MVISYGTPFIQAISFVVFFLFCSGFFFFRYLNTIFLSRLLYPANSENQSHLKLVKGQVDIYSQRHHLGGCISLSTLFVFKIFKKH